MKKNGFTLIELLGVIIVLVALSLVTFPIIMNQFKKNKKEISAVMKTLIEDATITYIDEHANTYKKIDGNTYCITLSQLVEAEKLELPLTDPTTGLEIPVAHRVKVTVQNRQYSPNYVADKQCTEIRV